MLGQIGHIGNSHSYDISRINSVETPDDHQSELEDRISSFAEEYLGYEELREVLRELSDDEDDGEGWLCGDEDEDED